MKYTVCVDFDGVLHSYTTGWHGSDVVADPPVAGAIEWLTAVAAVYDIVILTTRGGQEGAEAAILEWLGAHGYTGPPVRVTNEKPAALVYIDDRAIRFNGVFPTAAEIQAARPWNKPPP